MHESIRQEYRDTRVDTRYKNTYRVSHLVKKLSTRILTTSLNPGSTACSSWSESIAGSSVLVRGIEKASLKDGVDGDRFEFGDLVQEEQIERVGHLPIHDTG